MRAKKLSQVPRKVTVELGVPAQRECTKIQEALRTRAESKLSLQELLEVGFNVFVLDNLEDLYHDLVREDEDNAVAN